MKKVSKGTYILKSNIPLIFLILHRSNSMNFTNKLNQKKIFNTLASGFIDMIFKIDEIGQWIFKYSTRILALVFITFFLTFTGLGILAFIIATLWFIGAFKFISKANQIQNKRRSK
tara:strand:- start:362 stop:709 length:348 start_codon:yes stop_codon:yes gene_type:complete